MSDDKPCQVEWEGSGSKAEQAVLPVCICQVYADKVPQVSCTSVTEKQQETPILLDAAEDQATITSLEGTCADFDSTWDTLGGGCDVVCDDTRDLLRINMFASKSIATPGWKPSGEAYPVQCRCEDAGHLS